MTGMASSRLAIGDPVSVAIVEVSCIVSTSRCTTGLMHDASQTLKKNVVPTVKSIHRGVTRAPRHEQDSHEHVTVHLPAHCIHE